MTALLIRSVLGEEMSTAAYTRKAEDYAAYRPPYVDEAVNLLLDTTGLTSGWLVADIGSGTGNVARHLVDRARQVFAVEPDDAMRHQAEQLLGNHPSFTSIAGTAEETTLANCSIDLITVGQALHWFDQHAAQAEFARILRPSGWIALIWNRFGTPAEQADIPEMFAVEGCVRRSFPAAVKETWSQFIGGLRSAAGNPSWGDDGYAQFEQKQRELFDANAVEGLITVEYATELIVGRLNRRAHALYTDGDSAARPS